jgi:uncharacterized protein (TIGR02599 family)
MKTSVPICRRAAAFTLVEMLVSMAVLALLMAIIMDMINRTQTTVTRQQARAEEFKEARAALENISRSLSGAVINSYWAYGDASVSGKVNYTRQSDGHFVAGPAELLRGTAQNAPGHAMFFQGSDGRSTVAGSTSNVGEPYNLISCMGYYVEHETDLETRPEFLKPQEFLNPERKRFRLMELRVPPEENVLYSSAVNLNGITSRESGFQWFRGPFVKAKTPTAYATPLADNILALILVPRYIAVTYTGVSGESGTGSNQENTLSTTKPALDYYYDSREKQWGGTGEKARSTAHQLPPVVQITLIAAEERSYHALDVQLGPETLRDKVNEIFDNKFTNYNTYEADLAEVTEELTNMKLDHRVFTTNVSLRGSKWIVEERDL